MSPSYRHMTDSELLRECDQHYADPLIVELARRLIVVADERDELITDADRFEREITSLEDERAKEAERADSAELTSRERLDYIHELEQALAALQ